MNPPIIVYERRTKDVHVYDTIREAEQDIESIDAFNQEYLVFDSEGHLLSLGIDPRYEPRNWIDRLFPSIGTVTLHEEEDKTPHAGELRCILLDYIRLHENILPSRESEVQAWIGDAPLAELIAKVRSLS